MYITLVNGEGAMIHKLFFSFKFVDYLEKMKDLPLKSP